MDFKDYYLIQENVETNFCYMIYLEPPYSSVLAELQKSLNIQAKEIIKPNKFHCTIRHVKTSAGQSPKKFLSWLSEQQLPICTAFTKGFDIWDNSLVIKLESDELHNWFEKVNAHILHMGYAKSDFPTFKPHVSLSYDTTSPVPVFDDTIHKIELKFTHHIIQDHNKIVLFDKHSKTGLNFIERK